MARYSESELIELRSTAYIPTTVDFLEFTKAIEEQRQTQADLDATQSSRRRSSVHGNRPKFQFTKKPRQKHEAPQPDEDGWVTLNKKASEEGVQQQKETHKEQIRDQSINKIRANSKKMSSNSSGDTRDLLSEKPKSKFNAFAALNSEDDDESEEEEEEEDEE